MHSQNKILFKDVFFFSSTFFTLQKINFTLVITYILCTRYLQLPVNMVIINQQRCYTRVPEHSFCDTFQVCIAHTVTVLVCLKSTFGFFSSWGMNIPMEFKWAIFETLHSAFGIQEPPRSFQPPGRPLPPGDMQRCSVSSSWSQLLTLTQQLSLVRSFLYPHRPFLLKLSFLKAKFFAFQPDEIFFSFKFAKCFEGRDGVLEHSF